MLHSCLSMTGTLLNTGWQASESERGRVLAEAGMAKITLIGTRIATPADL